MISRIIQETCDKFEIPYKSRYSLNVDDIQTILECYSELNLILRKLSWIENKHTDILAFKETMHNAIEGVKDIKIKLENEMESLK